MNFKRYISQENDPAFNLALEEHLLKKRTENIFLLYTNRPSIIAGKHQNILAEISYKTAKKLELPIHRRLSGGGTVYHDLGNLNYCFITSTQPGELINFRHYSTLIAEALEKLDIETSIGKRHEINVNGFKVSGNASHVFKNRSLHHGTLLFNSNLKHLNDCLKNKPDQYIDKAVKSVKSDVTNIMDQLKTKMSYNNFTNFIIDSITDTNENKITLEKDDYAEIEKLRESKYKTWEWNFGYNPEYKTIKSIYIPKFEESVTLEMTIKKGLIESIELESNQTLVKSILKKLQGNILEPEKIKSLIYDDLKEQLDIKDPQTIIDELF